VWESFEDVGFPMSEKVWREKKLSAKYNGSLALATLERATIMSRVILVEKVKGQGH